MKIGVVGKGGVGKSTLISLLARNYTLDAFDADPLEGLSEVFPSAEKYDGTAVTEPSMIEFPLMERGFRLLSRDPEIKVVLVTTPHFHAVRATKGILETLRRYCPNEVVGVVVNQSGRDIAETVAERVGLKLIGSVPLETELDDRLVEREGIVGYKPSEEMANALRELAERLGLKERAKNKKNRGRRWLPFGR